MKTLLTIFLSFCFSILLCAEDLVLKNGKIYRDYEVIRKDKKGIKIRYTVHDGTLRYSRTKVISYQELNEKDQVKFQGCKIEYKITGAKEVDIFLIPVKLKKSPEFEVAEKGRYNDPEMACWYVTYLYVLLVNADKEQDKNLKNKAIHLIRNFPFRSTLIKLCEYKKIKTTPAGEIRKIPKGEYFFIALKKCHTDNGQPYYVFDLTKVSIDQLQTKIELKLEHSLITVD